MKNLAKPVSICKHAAYNFIGFLDFVYRQGFLFSNAQLGIWVGNIGQLIFIPNLSSEHS
jgi:hypothetical protein